MKLITYLAKFLLSDLLEDIRQGFVVGLGEAGSLLPTGVHTARHSRSVLTHSYKSIFYSMTL